MCEDLPEDHGGQSISGRERLKPVVVRYDCVLFWDLRGCSKAVNFKPQMDHALLAPCPVGQLTWHKITSRAGKS